MSASRLNPVSSASLSPSPRLMYRAISCSAPAEGAYVDITQQHPSAADATDGSSPSLRLRMLARTMVGRASPSARHQHVHTTLAVHAHRPNADAEERLQRNNSPQTAGRRITPPTAHRYASPSLPSRVLGMNDKILRTAINETSLAHQNTQADKRIEYDESLLHREFAATSALEMWDQTSLPPPTNDYVHTITFDSGATKLPVSKGLKEADAFTDSDLSGPSLSACQLPSAAAGAGSDVPLRTRTAHEWPNLYATEEMDEVARRHRLQMVEEEEAALHSHRASPALPAFGSFASIVQVTKEKEAACPCPDTNETAFILPPAPIDPILEQRIAQAQASQSMQPSTSTDARSYPGLSLPSFLSPSPTVSLFPTLHSGAGDCFVPTLPERYLTPPPPPQPRESPDEQEMERQLSRVASKRRAEWPTCSHQGDLTTQSSVANEFTAELPECSTFDQSVDSSHAHPLTPRTLSRLARWSARSHPAGGDSTSSAAEDLARAMHLRQQENDASEETTDALSADAAQQSGDLHALLAIQAQLRSKLAPATLFSCEVGNLALPEPASFTETDGPFRLPECAELDRPRGGYFDDAACARSARFSLPTPSPPPAAHCLGARQSSHHGHARSADFEPVRLPSPWMSPRRRNLSSGCDRAARESHQATTREELLPAAGSQADELSDRSSCYSDDSLVRRLCGFSVPQPGLDSCSSRSGSDSGSGGVRYRCLQPEPSPASLPAESPHLFGVEACMMGQTSDCRRRSNQLTDSLSSEPQSDVVEAAVISSAVSEVKISTAFCLPSAPSFEGRRTEIPSD